MEIISTLFAIGLLLMINPVIGLIVYVIPAILAMLFRRDNVLPIVIFNILFGWFLPGWIALLLWAMFGKTRDAASGGAGSIEYTHRACQFCAQLFPKDLASCPHCGKEQRSFNSYNPATHPPI